MKVNCIRRYRNINLLSIACPPQQRGMGLGIDLPWADEPSPGNRRFSADKILTCLFATYADILTSISSIKASAFTSSYNRTLPYQFTLINQDIVRSFGNML